MTITVEHYRRLERMYLLARVNEFYEPTIRIGDATTKITMQVKSEFFHVAGAVHGSVYFKGLDDAAFFAASSLVSDVFLLTSSFNIFLTRPIASGSMTATGHVLHRSARLFVAEAKMVDDDGRLLGHGSGTFMRSNIALSPELDYR